MNRDNYRHQIEIGWAVEFIRKDAEVTLVREPFSKDTRIATQRKIGSYPTRDLAESAAKEFAKKLADEIWEFAMNKIKSLPTAKE